jgi:hypothetical protein
VQFVSYFKLLILICVLKLERLRNLIQEENEELVKERNKLLKLANDAREIYNELKN